jgi:hypothetical protein
MAMALKARIFAVTIITIYERYLARGWRELQGYSFHQYVSAGPPLTGIVVSPTLFYRVSSTRQEVRVGM